MWADLRRLFDEGGTDLEEVIAEEVPWEKGGGVDGGRREKGGGELELGSEVLLSLLLKVQGLPFILLRLPMELRMTVARFMDRVDRSRLAAAFRSKLVLIRFWMSEEKEPALGMVIASKSSGRTRTFWNRK